MNLQGSVGIKGNNHLGDVKTVQSLLNENGSQPRLRVDGLCGKKTEAAIVWFQKRIVKLNTPDGRIDVNGKTWRLLRTRTGKKPGTNAPNPHSSSPEERKEFRSQRQKFVDPRVKEIKITTQIIDGIFPHFKETNVQVISGYLSDSDLFWKVNYHWDYLLWMIDHSKALPIKVDEKKQLDASKALLLSVSPSPNQGYRTSASVGKPKDTTSQQAMTQRHKVISQQKRVFKKITQIAKLIEKSPRSETSFHLAAAPVAHPGTSKHSTGYAIDLKGSAGTIKSTCKRLGASLIFDEKSHVHVEFKNGVTNIIQ